MTLKSLLMISCLSLGSLNAFAEEGAGDKMKEGWTNVKAGVKDVADGVSKAAQDTGHALKSVACPVVADQSSGLYYAKDTPGYDKILAGERPFHPDNRVCFASELAAREKKFRLAQ